MDPDSIGLAEQLVLGVGVFKSLFYENCGALGFTTPLRHNADAHQPSSAVSRPPRPCWSWSHHFIVWGVMLWFQLEAFRVYHFQFCYRVKTAIAMKNYSSTTSANAQQDGWIKPQTMFTRAQEARNGRKALACIMAADSQYKDFVKTGNLSHL